MASFNDWLRENQNKRDDTNALWVAATTLGREWPRSSLDKADYEDAIAKESDPAARARLLETLNRDWRAFRLTLTEEPQPAGSAGQSSWRLAAIGKFFAANAGVIATTLLVLVLAYFLSAIFSNELLDHLKDVPTARGLITFLFAFTTVGIFFIVVASNFLSNLQGDEFAKRYQNGKDVLTLLIGVFGTIIGFYFGQATTTSPNPPNVVVQTPPPPSPPAQPPAPPVSPSQPIPPGPTNPGNVPSSTPG
ncbi:MAG TPA: hypothetical protein VHN20_17505 [Beijerinckiaceae bacterium]|nr:hypothetical protein [Beijerinckiaceae bacterium]